MTSANLPPDPDLHWATASATWPEDQPRTADGELLEIRIDITAEDLEKMRADGCIISACNFDNRSKAEGVLQIDWSE